MEIPQAMLLDWANRLFSGTKLLSLSEVAQVRREMLTYATSQPKQQAALQLMFYLKSER